MIKLCTIDLDGTLFDFNKNISEQNKLAIKEAKKIGCKIVIASGRPIQGIIPVLRELNLLDKDDYFISYNGAKVLNSHTNEIVFSKTLSGKTIKELYQESKRLNVNYHAFKKNEMLITDIHNPYTDVEKRINHIEDYIVDFNDIKDDEEFLKCMMVSSDENITNALTKLNKKYYDQYSVLRSSKIFLEFLNKETNKGEALVALAKFLNIDLKDTMSIGDAGNDLSMIKNAGIGVAMKNAFKEVLEAADYVTSSNEESGVAEAINKFILNK